MDRVQIPSTNRINCGQVLHLASKVIGHSGSLGELQDKVEIDAVAEHEHARQVDNETQHFHEARVGRGRRGLGHGYGGNYNGMKSTGEHDPDTLKSAFRMMWRVFWATQEH